MDGPKFTDAFITYWAAGAADFARQVSAYSGKPISPEIVEPWTLGLAGLAADRMADLPGIVGYLLAFEEAYHAFFNDLDILLTPVTGSPAVAAALASTIAAAGTALSDRNRSGCPARP